jgi:hypothetical protein
MKMTRISCLFMVILLLNTTSVVTASDFSCGSKIITIKDHKHDVLRKCGEPSHVEVWEEVRAKRDLGFRLSGTEMALDRWPLLVKELVTVEEWEYNLGSTRFIRYLRFENGRLIKITEGDYGY